MKQWWFWCGLLLGPVMAAHAGTPLVSTQSVYYGMCDASAGVAIDKNLFAVANDEDNPIRIYHTEAGTLPLRTFDFSKFLRISSKSPELDLEGACWLGDRIFWISSHGRNHLGQFRPNRHRVFATEWKHTPQGDQLVPVGQPYGRLLNDLISDPRLSSFGLAHASRLPPKVPGALNIEGLCATPEGALLIGFRNPIPRQQALLVPLLNPTNIIAGKTCQLGDPILLDLGGLGVRDMAYNQGKYLIIAGPADAAAGRSVVYTWEGGKSAPQKVAGIELPNFNPEAIIVYSDRPGQFQLLSDDGTRPTDGMPCKELKDPTQRRFRSLWITLPELSGAGR